MVKEEFYFDSRDGGSKLHAVRYSPDRPEGVRCILQIVHGIAEYAERYEEFAEACTARGFVVTGEDHLGHGKSVGEGGKYGYICEQDPATVLVRDVHRLKKMTEALYPDIPYVILGHSMGSYITRNYMYRYGTGIAAAVIMGTGMQASGLVTLAKVVTGIQKLFCGSGHVAGLIDKLTFGSYNKKVSVLQTKWDWLSRDALKVKQYSEDPMCGFVFTVNGFGALFELLHRLHNTGNLAQIPRELPVLMLSGDADPVGSYGKGVQKAYDSLVRAGLVNIKLRMYAGSRHELLNETNRNEVMQDIFDWIESTVLQKR